MIARRIRNGTRIIETPRGRVTLYRSQFGGIEIRLPHAGGLLGLPLDYHRPRAKALLRECLMVQP